MSSVCVQGRDESPAARGDIICDPGLPVLSKMLYLALVSCATRGEEPSRKNLARVMGSSVRSVTRHLTEVQRVGLVDVVRAGGSTRYLIRDDYIPSEPFDADEWPSA